MMEQKMLTHARIDAPHLADGLFILTQGKKGRERNGRNRIVPTSWGDLKITFKCVEPLGDTEQSVLLALVARAGIDGKRISSNGQTKRGKELHALLNVGGSLGDRDGVCISTTMQEIIRGVGLADSGSAYEAVNDALERLGDVVVWVEDTATNRKGNTLLLSVSKRGDNLDIAINYRIREALKNTGFARVDLIERRELPTPTARLLHTFFSRWLKPGGSQKLSFEALARHVWADGFGESKYTRHRQKETLRNAMRAISELEKWRIEVLGDSCLVQRGVVGKASNEKRRNPTTRKGATQDEKRSDRVELATERIAA